MRTSVGQCAKVQWSATQRNHYRIAPPASARTTAILRWFLPSIATNLPQKYKRDHEGRLGVHSLSGHLFLCYSVSQRCITFNKGFGGLYSFTNFISESLGISRNHRSNTLIRCSILCPITSLSSSAHFS